MILGVWCWWIEDGGERNTSSFNFIECKVTRSVYPHTPTPRHILCRISSTASNAYCEGVHVLGAVVAMVAHRAAVLRCRVGNGRDHQGPFGILQSKSDQKTSSQFL